MQHLIFSLITLSLTAITSIPIENGLEKNCYHLFELKSSSEALELARAKKVVSKDEETEKKGGKPGKPGMNVGGYGGSGGGGGGGGGDGDKIDELQYYPRFTLKDKAIAGENGDLNIVRFFAQDYSSANHSYDMQYQQRNSKFKDSEALNIVANIVPSIPGRSLGKGHKLEKEKNVSKTINNTDHHRRLAVKTALPNENKNDVHALIQLCKEKGFWQEDRSADLNDIHHRQFSSVYGTDGSTIIKSKVGALPGGSLSLIRVYSDGGSLINLEGNIDTQVHRILEDSKLIDVNFLGQGV